MGNLVGRGAAEKHDTLCRVEKHINWSHAARPFGSATGIPHKVLRRARRQAIRSERDPDHLVSGWGISVPGPDCRDDLEIKISPSPQIHVNVYM